MSTSKTSPDSGTLNANLEFHRKSAKALLKALRAGESHALERLKLIHSGALPPEDVKLADAQLIIARENGFPSWPRFKRHIEEQSGATTPMRPYIREVEWYRDRAEGFRRAYEGKMDGVIPVIEANLPDWDGSELALDDALLIQARQHGYQSWQEFARHIEALKKGETQEPFLLAFEALQSDDLEALKTQLRTDTALANARGSNGNSLLNLAVSLRKKEAARILLEAGASVNLGNNYGWTPLHQVAIGASVKALESLIKRGGDLTLSARGDGGTPLVQALFWGNSAMADAIAQHDISPRNLRVAAGLGRLDLLEACFDAQGHLTPEAKDSREFYRPHGEFPEWSPSDDSQEILDEAFTYACRNGRTQVLPFLLDKGAKIEGDPYRGTGLIWATFKGHFETARWLLNHGVNIDAQATFGGRNHGKGMTALHLAAQDGEMEKVRFLIEHGANPDIPDHLFNSTATGWAEFLGHPEVAAYLLELPQAGILNLATRGLTERVARVLASQPELVNGYAGESRAHPLHRSVENGHIETVRLLLEKGADASLVQADGRTALDIAVAGGDEGMIGVLREFS